MAGGVVAAFVGPNLAHWTSSWLDSVEFAGSFLSLLGIYALSLFALLFVRIPGISAVESHEPGRPLVTLARQPAYLVALLGGALGYGVMALVMTATPLAMHQHAHAFAETAFVIEWHLLGMFVPAFFTGHLIRRFGVLNIMVVGALLYLACVAVNLAGADVAHFWAGLLLLGVGWNFLFVGGTTLLTETYREAEKAKAQALNDFTVFTVITVSVLSAGALQHHLGWRTVNLGVLPMTAVILAGILWLRRQRRAQSDVASARV
jgi:MFS family permease